MSFRTRDGVTVICEESETPCELCGNVAETRPYGPNGAEICFACGQKDREATQQRIGEVLFGEKPKPVIQ